jgi:iron(III) transport system ATP-binding protein
MVFQSYALWPHMNVWDNVAYGLKVRRVAAAERQRRVTEALRTVQMEPYARRRPAELSGGQQQRVALARALVVQPTVLLLDEPLSNLDAKLRLEMRSEIKRICTRTGITTVYVTHDQKEALSMADRIAILRDGMVVQVGSARELYERPGNRFVADFLGEANFLAAVVRSAGGGRVVIETAAGLLTSTAAPGEVPAGAAVTCCLRPEALAVATTPREENCFPGRRLETTYLGDMAQHVVQVASGITLRVTELSPLEREGDEQIFLAVDPTRVVVILE